MAMRPAKRLGSRAQEHSSFILVTLVPFRATPSCTVTCCAFSPALLLVGELIAIVPHLFRQPTFRRGRARCPARSASARWEHSMLMYDEQQRQGGVCESNVQFARPRAAGASTTIPTDPGSFSRPREARRHSHRHSASSLEPQRLPGCIATAARRRNLVFGLLNRLLTQRAR